MSRKFKGWLGRGYRRLFVRKRFYRLHHVLFRLAVHGLGIQNSGSFGSSGERHFISQLARGWPAGAVVLDVGANEGGYAAQVLAQHPGVQVYAFEPHPETFDRLSAQAAQRGFKAFHLACGDQPGRITLFDYAERDGSTHASVYRAVFDDLHEAPVKAHEVDVTTLDEFIRMHGLAHIDLLKIDTEGHELSVLQGAHEALRRAMIDVIQFEFNEMHVISRVFMRDFARLLEGFRLYRLLPDGAVPLPHYRPMDWELFGDQNIVAVRGEAGIRIE
ncbi:MAG: FkbM family methyltransferase [Candidatus Lambdaproteobacteria bacterium]|nr:FkbM family methyltransferase [Candidatus Lambdaproteobacteria bacterium]